MLCYFKKFAPENWNNKKFWMRNMLNKYTFQPKTADLVLMCLKLHLTIMNLSIITKNHHPHLRSTCPPRKGMPLRTPLPRRSQWWRKRRRMVSGILCIWHLAVGTYWYNRYTIMNSTSILIDGRSQFSWISIPFVQKEWDIHYFKISIGH